MCLVCDHLYFQPAREEIPMSAPTSLRRVHRVCDDWHQRVLERARELHAAHRRAMPTGWDRVRNGSLP
jgi:hypothetical protein